MRPIETSLLMRRRRKRKELRRHSPSGRVQQTILALGTIITAVLVGFGLALAGAYSVLSHDLPDVGQLEDVLGPQSPYLEPTVLYDRSGERALLTLATPGVERRYLSIDVNQAEHVSADLAQLTVAAEDPDYYRHPGVTWASLWGGQQTITGRLATEYLLEDEAEGLRKNLRIAILALRMTGRYGREQILEWYLNSADYGHLAYGAEAAAQTYLGKSAADLDLAEAAWLVSAQLNPDVDPLVEPEKALELQANLLDRLLVEGRVDGQDYLQTRSETVKIRTDVAEPVSQAPALTDLALEQLYAALGADVVERGGLKVETTLDVSLQEQAECLLRVQLGRSSGESLEESDYASCSAINILSPASSDSSKLISDLSGSAIVLDPQSGEILALIGEINAAGEQGALQAHPAGTLLAPFVYLTGFTQGLSPATLVWDVPGKADNLATATISSNAADYNGPESIRAALLSEDIAPAWQIIDQVGSDAAGELLGRMGWIITDTVENDEDRSTFPFGNTQVTLLDAARSFSILAGEGGLAGRVSGDVAAGPQPAALLQVTDSSGEVIYDGSAVTTQSVVSASLAYLVISVLADEETRQVVNPEVSPDIGRTAAVQSGVSEDGLNGWTVGYTPQRVVGVWIGSGSASGDYSAEASQVWAALAGFALADLPDQGWDEPAGIVTAEVCEPSGLLPTETCPTRRSEVFLAGSEPVEYDDLSVRLAVNRENGLLATIYTPEELVEEREYVDIPEEYRDWALSAGWDLPPTDYDTAEASAALEDVHFDGLTSLQAVKGKISLRGTATLEDFAYYRVLFGKGRYPSEWEPLGDDIKQPVTGGILSDWDTSQLEDGVYALRLMVVDTKNRYREADLLVTVDNHGPEVKVLAPQAGGAYEVEAGRSMVFRAELTDTTGVVRVAWYLDGKALAVQEQEPFAAVWQPEVGEHRLRVVAYDAAGNAGEEEIEFTIIY